MIAGSTGARQLHHSRGWASAAATWRRFAWLVIVVADVGLLAWGAMAAFVPDRLLGPNSTPILAADYSGFTGGSWQVLLAMAPRTAEFATLLFRMFGIYIVAFCLLAIAIAAKGFRAGDRWCWWALLIGNTIAFLAPMAYDQICRAVGPFEASEYLGLAAIYASLAVKAPFGAGGRSASAAS